MLVLPPGTPVPDPCYAVLRGRHPDVDLVLLRRGPAPPPHLTEVADPTGRRDS